MKRSWISGLAAVVLIATPAVAQRGTGAASGVARGGAVPPVTTLSGTLAEVHTGPCAATTGCAPTGTHLVVKTADGESRPIHLGPAGAVAEVVSALPVGKPVTVEAFRTDGLEPGHAVAKALTIDGRTVTLRDARLRPVWAGGGGRDVAVADAEDTPSAAARPGGGPGGGCCFGAGRAAGAGPGPGRGMGFGAGRGPGGGRGFRGGRGPA
jgi:hypothetical protein